MNKINFRKMAALLMGCLVSQLCFTASAYDGYCNSPLDVIDLPPGHWCEVPNSQARQVEKKASEWDDFNGISSAKYLSYQGFTGFKAIMDNWSGGAFDSKRDRLLIFGGGHNGYGGNEILAFDLHSLKWQRITDPTPFPNINGYYNNTNPITPVSRHTYGGLAYIEDKDLFFAFDGSGFNSGATRKGTWTFDLAKAVAGNSSTNYKFWSLRTDVGEPKSGYDRLSVYDPNSHRVFLQSPSGIGSLWSYDYAANKWTRHYDKGSHVDAFGAIDPVQKKMYLFSSDPKNRVGNVRITPLSGDLTSTLSYETVPTHGGAEIESANDPGVAYDPTINKIVAYRSSTNVYIFDTNKLTWEKRPAPNTNQADPGAPSAQGGIFGRFRYSERLNVYVYVNGVDNNVFLYRLGDSVARPSPPGNVAVE